MDKPKYSKAFQIAMIVCSVEDLSQPLGREQFGFAMRLTSMLWDLLTPEEQRIIECCEQEFTKAMEDLGIMIGPLTEAAGEDERKVGWEPIWEETDG